jgi:hypothetical protein
MIHLRSEIPIQRRSPVAQSQIANRENVSGECIQGTQLQGTTIPTHAVGNDFQHQTIISSKSQSLSQNPCNSSLSPQTVRSPVNNHPETLSLKTSYSGAAPTQCSHSSYEHPTLSYVRITTTFGYNPATAENLIPLSSLYSKSHGDTIGNLPLHTTNADCIAIIQSIFPIKTVGSINKAKRDLHIIDPSQPRYTILSGKTLKELNKRSLARFR